MTAIAFTGEDISHHGLFHKQFEGRMQSGWYSFNRFKEVAKKYLKGEDLPKPSEW
jgi:hypothetical protein